MTVKDVTAPIKKIIKTTWWAHNPQYHRIETWLSGTPISSKLFLTIGFVWRSPTTFLETIYSGIRCNTYSRCSGPLSPFVSGIERLPTRSKLLMVPPYFALDTFFSLNSGVTSHHLPCVIDQIINLAEVRSPGIPPLCSFLSMMEILKEGRRFHHDALRHRSEDINAMDPPLRGEQPKTRRSIRIS